MTGRGPKNLQGRPGSTNRGLGFRVWGLGFRVYGLGLGFMVYGLGFRV